jgi:hypothetical protein
MTRWNRPNAAGTDWRHVSQVRSRARRIEQPDATTPELLDMSPEGATVVIRLDGAATTGVHVGEGRWRFTHPAALALTSAEVAAAGVRACSWWPGQGVPPR